MPAATTSLRELGDRYVMGRVTACSSTTRSATVRGPSTNAAEGTARAQLEATRPRGHDIPGVWVCSTVGSTKPHLVGIITSRNRDRKRIVYGKSVYVSVAQGVVRINKK